MEKYKKLYKNPYFNALNYTKFIFCIIAFSRYVLYYTLSFLLLSSRLFDYLTYTNVFAFIFSLRFIYYITVTVLFFGLWFILFANYIKFFFLGIFSSKIKLGIVFTIFLWYNTSVIFLWRIFKNENARTYAH